jgi:hypothetical protein
MSGFIKPFHLCVVCQNCDGNLMESEWQVVDEEEAALLALTSREAKERLWCSL